MKLETKVLVVAMLAVLGLFAWVHVPAEMAIPYLLGLALYVNVGVVDEANSRGIMRHSKLLAQLSKWSLNPNLVLVLVTSLFVLQAVLYAVPFIPSANPTTMQTGMIVFKLFSAGELVVSVGLCIGDCTVVLGQLYLRFLMQNWLERQRFQMQLPILAFVGIGGAMTIVAANQHAASMYIAGPLCAACFGMFIFFMNASVGPLDVLLRTRNDPKMLVCVLAALMLFGFILSSPANGFVGDVLVVLSKVATIVELIIAGGSLIVGMGSYVQSRQRKFHVSSDLSV